MSNTFNKKTKRNIVSALIIILLVAADQIIKYYVDLLLKPVDAVTVIPKVLQFKYLENTGAMMGFMSGKIDIMIGLSLVCFIAVAVAVFSGKINNRVDFVSLVMICAGGFGNIIDRIFRGYVIDYIEVLFVDFYVFNFADCLITVSAFLLFFNQIYLIYVEQKNKKAEAKK